MVLSPRRQDSFAQPGGHHRYLVPVDSVDGVRDSSTPSEPPTEDGGLNGTESAETGSHPGESARDAGAGGTNNPGSGDGAGGGVDDTASGDGAGGGVDNAGSGEAVGALSGPGSGDAAGVGSGPGGVVPIPGDAASATGRPRGGARRETKSAEDAGGQLPEDLAAMNELKDAWVHRCEATGCDVGPEDDEERLGLLLAIEAAATSDAMSRVRDVVTISHLGRAAAGIHDRCSAKGPRRGGRSLGSSVGIAGARRRTAPAPASPDHNRVGRRTPRAPSGPGNADCNPHSHRRAAACSVHRPSHGLLQPAGVRARHRA